MPKACASHGSLKTGTSSSRGTCGRAERSGVVMRQPMSRGIEVIVPEVHVDGVTRRGLGPPQLPRGEADAVEVLRLLALPHRVRIGEDEDAVVAVDGAPPTAHVARQSRMADGIEVARDDAVAGLEPGRDAVRKSRRAALEEHSADVGSLEHSLWRRHAVPPTRLDLVACDQALFEQEQLEAQEPLLVVARREVPGGRSEEHTSELQSQSNLVCRLLLEKKKKFTSKSATTISYRRIITKSRCHRGSTRSQGRAGRCRCQA